MRWPFDFIVGIAIFVAVIALFIAAETQRVKPRSPLRWLLPLFFPATKDEFTPAGWSFVLAKRILLGIGFVWPLISFLRHSPRR